jgi:hypothetical protein
MDASAPLCCPSRVMRSKLLIPLLVLAWCAPLTSTAQAGSCPGTSDAYSQAVLTDSPIAYYRLDESAGPTMCDSSTSANDGTYGSTGITYGVAGAIPSSTDTAVSGDGTPTEIGQSNADPAGLTGNHAYTLEAWFKNDETTAPYTNQWLVGLGGTGSTGQAAVLSLDPNHGSQLGWGPTSSFGIDQYGADWAWDPTTASVNLWDGNWHYIAVTHTPSDTASASDYVGYVDGQDIGSPDARPYGNDVTDIAASPIILGQGCSANGCYWLPFDAGLDEVAVYGTALTPAQITAHWNAAHDLELAVSRAGTGSGKVVASPTGISCPTTCSYAYASSTVVTLTATAAPGSRFAGWSGAGCSGTGKCQVTLSSATTVRATFNTIPPPNTAITHASVVAAKRKATFDFTGSGGVGALHFQCRLDSGSWKNCDSPKTYTGLSRARHTFSVRAIDKRGKADPTPAIRSFTI